MLEILIISAVAVLAALIVGYNLRASKQAKVKALIAEAEAAAKAEVEKLESRIKLEVKKVV